MFFAAAAFPLLGGARPVLPVVVLRCFSRKHGSVCAPGRPFSGCSSFVFRCQPRRYIQVCKCLLSGYQRLSCVMRYSSCLLPCIIRMPCSNQEQAHSSIISMSRRYLSPPGEQRRRLI